MLIQGLRQKIFNDFKFLENSNCILLKYPGHLNGGDGFIWLGESRLFSDLHMNIILQLPDTRIDKLLTDALDFDTVLIHGGGNFGDIWPGFNEFHIKVLQLYKDKRVVQLPETIQFNSYDGLEKIKIAINNHPNFLLTVRDRISYDFAVKHFSCKILLTPDLAFYSKPKFFNINRQIVKYPSVKTVLFFLRTDQESLVHNKLPADGKDWLDCQSRLFVIREKILEFGLSKNYFKLFPKFFHLSSLMRYIKKAYYHVLVKYHKKKFYEEIGNVIRIIEGHKLVVTDRLHVHILCTLLRKPNILLSNNYHKNQSVFNAWTRSDPIADSCSDLHELDDKIKAILAITS